MVGQVEILESDASSLAEQEKLYLALRRKEGRVWTDEALLSLPEIATGHPLYGEWEWRKRSCRRLLAYLSHRFQGGAQVLDLGCGNGWMSRLLAQQARRQVVAVDVNLEELRQGARMFSGPQLSFVYADMLNNPAFQARYADFFDVAVLAASVQYFPDLERAIASIRRLLKPGGEIHCIDSPFYRNENALSEARRRSLAYFSGMGFPEMAAFYHHHSRLDAERLGAVNLNGLRARLLQRLGYLPPFPWMRFRKEL